MTRGASLIARIALEHPERPVREVLAELVAHQKTIAGVARALDEARPCVRAALDAFGLRGAAPVDSEAHAEATRSDMPMVPPMVHHHTRHPRRAAGVRGA